MEAHTKVSQSMGNATSGDRFDNTRYDMAPSDFSNQYLFLESVHSVQSPRSCQLFLEVAFAGES